MSNVYGQNTGALVSAAPGAQVVDSLQKQGQIYDSLVMPRAISATIATPPGAPSDGDTYIVPTAATGAWAGKTNHIMRYNADNADNGIVANWLDIIPRRGWEMWVDDANSGQGAMLRYTGSAWAGDSGSASDTTSLVNGITPVNGKIGVTFGTGGVFDITLTDNAALNFYGMTGGKISKARLVVRQDGSGHTLTWPAGTYWSGGAAPDVRTDNGAVNVYDVETHDGGVSYIAQLVARSLYNASGLPPVYTPPPQDLGAPYPYLLGRDGATGTYYFAGDKTDPSGVYLGTGLTTAKTKVGALPSGKTLVGVLNGKFVWYHGNAIYYSSTFSGAETLIANLTSYEGPAWINGKIAWVFITNGATDGVAKFSFLNNDMTVTTTTFADSMVDAISHLNMMPTVPEYHNGRWFVAWQGTSSVSAHPFYNDTYRAYSSPDGINWVKIWDNNTQGHARFAYAMNAWWMSIEEQNGGTPITGQMSLYKSTDGVTFTRTIAGGLAQPGVAGASPMGGNSTTLVIAGASGAVNQPYWLYTMNGTSLTQLPGAPTYAEKIDYIDGHWYLKPPLNATVDGNRSNFSAYTSDDLSTWTYLTLAGIGTTSQYVAYTKSILNFEGADGATTTTDDTGRAITLTGGAAISTAKHKFGNSSLVLPSASTAQLHWAAGAGLDFSTAPQWCIEFFMQVEDNPRPVNQVLFWQGATQDTSGANGMWAMIDSNRIYVWFQSDNAPAGSALEFDSLVAGATNDNAFNIVESGVNRMHHVAFQRNGNDFILAVDGKCYFASSYTAQGLGYFLANTGMGNIVNGANQLNFGRGTSASNLADIWIDSVRVLIGVAPYTTATYQVPTTPFAMPTPYVPTPGDNDSGWKWLRTNGTLNGNQNTLNLKSGSGITLTDDGSGGVSIAATVTGGVTSITGTANQVIASAATGAVTLSLPQNINAGATPSWAQITLGADPTSAMQAVTKQYADNIAANLTPKGTARLATTANITLSGLQTIDGVSGAAGDRVVVKNQTTAAQNGVYVMASGAWARATDMDTWAEVPGAYLWVQEGTINGDTAWVVTSNGGGTLGTTAINWTQWGGTGTITAGAGISVTGNQVSLSAGAGTNGQVLGNVSGTPTWQTPGTIWTQNANAVAITGGTIDGTIIGGATPAAGTFTSVRGNIAATNAAASSYLQTPALNQLNLGIGSSASASAAGVNDFSAAMRFYGVGVAYADVAFFPKAALSDGGQLRFTSTGSAVTTTPNLSVGVGSLYSKDKVMVGTLTSDGVSALQVTGQGSLTGGWTIGGNMTLTSTSNPSVQASGATLNMNGLGGVLLTSYGKGAMFQVVDAGTTAIYPEIRGDFSNADQNQHAKFRTNVTNGGTDIYIVPNGTSNFAGHRYFENGADLTNSAYGFVGMSGGVFVIGTQRYGSPTVKDLQFTTAGAERMRISAAGNITVGGVAVGGGSQVTIPSTGSQPGLRISNTASPGIAGMWSDITGSNTLHFYFSNGGTGVGSITGNTTSVAFNTTSDYRLKENIVPILGEDARRRVMALQPKDFNYRRDETKTVVHGFIAHEVQEVNPHAVTGEKDAVREVDTFDENGQPNGKKEEPVYQGMDNSFLIPDITALQQWHENRIADLEALVQKQAALIEQLLAFK